MKLSIVSRIQNLLLKRKSNEEPPTNQCLFFKQKYMFIIVILSFKGMSGFPPYGSLSR